MDKNYTIYAVDFDGTLCEDQFPAIGKPNISLIEYLERKRVAGDKLILWTCRVGERLQEVVRWCGKYGLEFDAVNDNLIEISKFYGANCRKVYADIYIEDKAVSDVVYNIPYYADEGL